MAGTRPQIPWADRHLSFTSLATINTTLPEYVEVDQDNEELNEGIPPPPHEHIPDNQIETSGRTSSVSRPLVLSDGSRYDPLSGYWIINPEYLRLSEDRHNQTERQWPEHRVRYGMAVAGNAPWVKLYIYGRKSPPSSSGTKAAQFPSVYGGGAIHGLVDLNIQNGSRSIHRISLKLRGKLVSAAVSGDGYTFCEETMAVWDNSNTSPSARHQGSTKFTGSHKFPFRFPFPTHVDLKNRRLYYAANPSEAILDFATSAGSGSPIPACQPTSGFRSLFSALVDSHSRSPDQRETNHTVLDSSLVTAVVKGSVCPVLAPLPHSSPATTTCDLRVKYDLIMTITHGRLTPNTSIKTTIRHIPRLLVPSSPVSRHSDHPHPKANPSSWVEGTPRVFRRRGDANLSLQLRPYLLKPGVYLPAGTIRICLLVELDGFKFDSVALGPSNYPRVVLVRRHDYLDILDPSMPIDREALSSEDGEQIFARPHLPVSMAGTVLQLGSISRGETIPDISPSRKAVSGTASKISNVAEVTWASQREADADLVEDASVKPPGRLDHTVTPRRLWMFGSIVLPGDLEPSSMCPIYRIQYSVDMVPPDLSRGNSMFGAYAPCESRPDGMAPTLQLFRIEIGTLPQPERPP